MNIQQRISELVAYALDKRLIDPLDVDYAVNRLLHLLHLDDFSGEVESVQTIPPLTEILNDLTDYAVQQGIIETDIIELRDLFDTELMNCFVPHPSVVNRQFWTYYQESPTRATDFFYELSQNTNYIRTDRIARNLLWQTETKYGPIELTINLSKPEKDPKAIALQKSAQPSHYPKCPLCKENVGYHGRVNHAGRASHRIIPVTLNGENWFLQYSPYVYYQEHSIILSEKHEPMRITENTFKRLLEFVKQFPHYFIGSNADLPIVGGSILNHDHYQGGRAVLPMQNAKDIAQFTINGVKASILQWPLSVIRLKDTDIEPLVELATTILGEWRNYSNEEMGILSHSGDEPHNTITPIARFRDGNFELDLVLRNNRTTEEYPLGIFHPHAEHHHLKKENIGLIEVMGCAILPARLKDELSLIEQGLLGKIDLNEEPSVEKHLHWVEEMKQKYTDLTLDNVGAIIQQEVGEKFVRILEQCGVYPQTKKGLEAFKRFILSCPVTISYYTELSR